eukprot:TRINITY_DN3660_c0_g1_i2.p1 TRINITY_DN3660_c0_g1~~TRINITY_DN3660_c0_g1_i2.p1  ORF type:complete len:158 (-),score=8.83 TRINITY_DN3660_c0_g1_i2:610-1083(-)
MIRRPPRSTHCISSAASDVYKRQVRDRAIIGVRQCGMLQNEKQYRRQTNRVYLSKSFIFLVNFQSIFSQYLVNNPSIYKGQKVLLQQYSKEGTGRNIRPIVLDNLIQVPEVFHLFYASFQQSKCLFFNSFYSGAYMGLSKDIPGAMTMTTIQELLHL